LYSSRSYFRERDNIEGSACVQVDLFFTILPLPSPEKVCVPCRSLEAFWFCYSILKFPEKISKKYRKKKKKKQEKRQKKQETT
jgi:hypothetical protein